MNVLLIGPPGSGKGTQGAVLADRLNLQHIAAGDLLRHEVASGTDLGRAVEHHLTSGTLVPDELILDLVMPTVVDAARGGGYLLDGFPRTVAQAEQAAVWRAPGQTDETAPPDAVIVLDVPTDTLVERTLARGRDDDTDEVVRHRLDVYEAETAPVIAFFRERGLVHHVDGTMPVDQVSDAILAELDVPRA
ncbi:adenylate kinase [Jatrophihabitans sp. YIM 134969]